MKGFRAFAAACTLFAASSLVGVPSAAAELPQVTITVAGDSVDIHGTANNDFIELACVDGDLIAHTRTVDEPWTFLEPTVTNVGVACATLQGVTVDLGLGFVDSYGDTIQRSQSPLLDRILVDGGPQSPEETFNFYGLGAPLIPVWGGIHDGPGTPVASGVPHSYSGEASMDVVRQTSKGDVLTFERGHVSFGELGPSILRMTDSGVRTIPGKQRTGKGLRDYIQWSGVSGASVALADGRRDRVDTTALTFGIELTGALEHRDTVSLGAMSDSAKIEVAGGSLDLGAGSDRLQVPDVGPGTPAGDPALGDVMGGPGEDNLYLEFHSIEPLTITDTAVTTPSYAFGLEGFETGSAHATWVDASTATMDLWISQPDPATSAVLRGGSGDDYLEASAGGSEIYGGGGDDEVHVPSQSAGNQLFGGGGHDELWGGSGLLVGGDGDDFLVGGYGADEISGGDGADTLRGSRGDDHLDGGLGLDSLNGGSEIDTCVDPDDSPSTFIACEL